MKAKRASKGKYGEPKHRPLKLKKETVKDLDAGKKGEWVKAGSGAVSGRIGC